MEGSCCNPVVLNVVVLLIQMGKSEPHDEFELMVYIFGIIGSYVQLVMFDQILGYEFFGGFFFEALL